MLSWKQFCVLGVFIVAVLISGFLITNNYLAVNQVPAHRIFTTGDVYEYQISLISNQSNITYPLTETVISADPERIQLEIFRNSEKISPEDQKFLVEIDPEGKIISTTARIPVIPEMQPELPGLLTLMQNKSNPPIPKGWVLQKDGIYSVNNTEVRYYASATGHYECPGTEQVSVAAGTFESTVIKSVAKINYTQVIYGARGNMTVTTRGEITGTYWIDAKTGILIQSDHVVSKIVATEQHELYQNRGLPVDQVYREIPSTSRIVCGLRSLHIAGQPG